MIVILSKQEIAKLRQMKLKGKSDQMILLSIMKTAKFDLREAKDFSEEMYPKLDMNKILKEVASEPEVEIEEEEPIVESVV
jgi:hypothetical protein